MQPLLFWKGETLLNDYIGNKPLPVLIKDLQNTDDPDSGLRGVSDDNQPHDYLSTDVNPSSGSNIKPSNKLDKIPRIPTKKESSKSDHGFRSYNKPK
jgi:hypothetical protein